MGDDGNIGGHQELTKTPRNPHRHPLIRNVTQKTGQSNIDTSLPSLMAFHDYLSKFAGSVSAWMGRLRSIPQEKGLFNKIEFIHVH